MSDISIEITRTISIIETTVVNQLRCSICKTIKPLSDFNHDRSRSTGYSKRCRECDHKTRVERYKNSVYQSNGLTGFWSKYGGRRGTVASNQFGDVTVKEEWCCQSCGSIQPPELTPYRFQYPENEFIRVCAICLSDKCKRLFERLKGYAP